METYTITELGGFITVSSGAVATILFALQKSTCTEIGCCGCHCKRDPKLIKKNINPESNDTPRPTPKTLEKENEVTLTQP